MTQKQDPIRSIIHLKCTSPGTPRGKREDFWQWFDASPIAEKIRSEFPGASYRLAELTPPEFWELPKAALLWIQPQGGDQMLACINEKGTEAYLIVLAMEVERLWEAADRRRSKMGETPDDNAKRQRKFKLKNRLKKILIETK